MAVINYEIFNVLGTISEGNDGKKKQLTVTAWGRYNPKFDLRAWNEEYTQMSKGITLSLEEIVALRDLLNTCELEKALEEALEEKEANKKEAKEEE